MKMWFRDAVKLLLAVVPFVAVGTGAQTTRPADTLPAEWRVDPSLYPKAYGVLADEHLMYPTDMSDWPVRIDSSRQLFSDDYLIASMNGVTRRVHAAKKHPKNPLIVPDRPWEGNGTCFQFVRREGRKFRMWYSGNSRYELPGGERAAWPGCYAESEDGIAWTKPKLGRHAFGNIADTNIVIAEGPFFGLMYTPGDPDPDRRYKAPILRFQNTPREGYFLYTSPDGLHWKQAREERIAVSLRGYTLPQSGIGDTSLFSWDERLGRYVGDVKFVLPGRKRVRGMMESDDLIHWSRPRMTIHPDGLDDPVAQIYQHVGFIYESMWLGFLRVYHETWDVNSSKQTTVELTASRDGRHWTRVGRREEVIPLGRHGVWDAHYHDPSPPLLVDNELWIYYRSSPIGPRKEGQRHCIGLATLRRDGFVSLNAAESPGMIHTRPLTFTGQKLFVNAEIGEGGYLKAELQDSAGKTVGPYALNRCIPVKGDVVAAPVRWRECPTITQDPNPSSLRLVFELKQARLYAFWIE